MEGEESSGGSANSGKGEKRRNLGSRGFERPVRTVRKPADKRAGERSGDFDAEQVAPIRFSGAWSGAASAADLSPRGGRGAIPTSPASSLQMALRRDEAAGKEDAKAEAAAVAAAAATAATAKQEEVGGNRGSGSHARRISSGSGTTTYVKEEDTSSLFSSDYFSAEDEQSNASLSEYSIATTDAASAFSSMLAASAAREDATAASAVTARKQPNVDKVTEEEQLRRSFTRVAGIIPSSDERISTGAPAPVFTVGSKYSIARSSKYSIAKTSKDSIATTSRGSIAATDEASSYSTTPSSSSNSIARTGEDSGATTRRGSIAAVDKASSYTSTPSSSSENSIARTSEAGVATTRRDSIAATDKASSYSTTLSSFSNDSTARNSEDGVATIRRESIATISSSSIQYSTSRASTDSVATTSRESVATRDEGSCYNASPSSAVRAPAAAATAMATAEPTGKEQLTLDTSAIDEQLRRNFGHSVGSSWSNDPGDTRVVAPPTFTIESAPGSDGQRKLQDDTIAHHLHRSFSSETCTSASSDRGSSRQSHALSPSGAGDNVDGITGGSECNVDGGDTSRGGDAETGYEGATAAASEDSSRPIPRTLAEASSQCHSWIWDNSPSTVRIQKLCFCLCEGSIWRDY